MTYLTYKRKPAEIARLTQEQLARDYQWCRQAVEQNLTTQRNLLQQHRTLRESAAAIWGTDSKEYRSISRMKLPVPPDLMKEYQKVLTEWRQIEAERQRLAKQREYGRDYRRRQIEAVDWLEAHGYKHGVDFERSWAISFKREVEAKQDMVIEGPPLLASDE